VEALIDFGEGEDIEEGVFEQGTLVLTSRSSAYAKTCLARAEAKALLSQIQRHLSDNRRGELVRSGIKMAIFGPPNAGKSSLFNYLGPSLPFFSSPSSNIANVVLTMVFIQQTVQHQ
jgi:tRNA modification GTPase